MDSIIKAVIFGGKARVAVIDTTAALNKAIKLHNMSPLSAAILGRSLTAGAYISANLKGKKERFNLIIDGGGISGKVCVAGTGGGIIKGFVTNAATDLPFKNGKLDVGGAVGANGEIIIIKDLGLKEPYIGKCKLVSGEIAEDYAKYLLQSEGIASAVALGVLNDKNGCKASGGVIVEALPSADDNIIVMLEDIMTNFKNVSSVLCEKSASEIMQYYFGHLDCQIFEPEPIIFKCDCKNKIENIVKGLGLQEAQSIIDECGKIEVHCDYCGKTYSFTNEDTTRLFGGK